MIRLVAPEENVFREVHPWSGGQSAVITHSRENSRPKNLAPSTVAQKLAQTWEARTRQPLETRMELISCGR